jgi:hypothetical protein
MVNKYLVKDKQYGKHAIAVSTHLIELYFDFDYDGRARCGTTKTQRRARGMWYETVR